MPFDFAKQTTRRDDQSDSDWHEPSYLVTPAAEFEEGRAAWFEPPSSVPNAFIVSKIDRVLREQLHWDHKRWPLRLQPEVSDLFEHYKGEWEEDTCFTSNLSDKILHPAYQHIIGLGPQVVPNILATLRDEGGDWYWALFAITGMDIAAGTETPTDATERWVEWGRDRGYIN